MSLAPTPNKKLRFNASYNQLVIFVLLGITFLRSGALFLTPLDLGVDEAQYWLWSQNLDFGYFTKPPLIAWIIGTTHWIFGHHSWAVRLPACWIHFATALLLWRGAVMIFGQNAGRLAALIWISLPATGLGSFLISTDTPLLCLWSAGLLALCGVASHRLGPATGMMLAGTAFGVAMLAKFAAIYALIGIFMIASHSHLTKKSFFSWRHLAIAIISFGVAASPTIIWNYANDFSTFRHLSDNANIDNKSYDLSGVWHFFWTQFAVAGPLVFTVMILATKQQWGNHQTRWLVWMSAPILTLMIIQSFISDTNANWAMPAYPALTIMAAGWLAGFSSQKLWIATISINMVIIMLVIVVSLSGSLGPLAPKSDPMRRLRGWQQLANDLRPFINAHRATAVIADRRATAALLSWHFYNEPIKILVHDADAIPSNHFEANHSWRPESGRHLVALSGSLIPPQINNITWLPAIKNSSAIISQTKTRDLNIFYGIE